MRYSSEAEDKIREECCPDKPFIVYRNEPSAELYLVNPQMCNGTFSMNLPIYQNDTPAKMKARMVRMDKLIKGKSYFLTYYLYVWICSTWNISLCQP